MATITITTISSISVKPRSSLLRFDDIEISSFGLSGLAGAGRGNRVANLSPAPFPLLPAPLMFIRGTTVPVLMPQQARAHGLTEVEDWQVECNENHAHHAAQHYDCNRFDQR